MRILGQAAGGRVDNQAVFELVALTALVWLPIILTLTLFVSVLMTLTRAYRDSEMVGVVYRRTQPDCVDRARSALRSGRLSYRLRYSRCL